MFDRVFVGGDDSAIWWVGGVIFGLFLIRAATGVANRVVMTRVSQQTVRKMQVDLLRHLMTLDGGFYQPAPARHADERVQSDTAAVQGVWQVLIGGLGRDVISLVSLFVVALAIDWLWTLVALVGAPAPDPADAGAAALHPAQDAPDAREAGRRCRPGWTRSSTASAPIKLNLMEGYQLARFQTVIVRHRHAPDQDGGHARAAAGADRHRDRHRLSGRAGGRRARDHRRAEDASASSCRSSPRWRWPSSRCAGWAAWRAPGRRRRRPRADLLAVRHAPSDRLARPARRPAPG